MNAGLPIDYDHATDFGAPEGRPAPAAGWIRELEVRGGAVWGRVEWTTRAASSIVAREYRYVSPVFQFDPKDGVVTRLLRAGLTNNPNLHLTAIAASHTAAANNETKDEHMEFPSQELRELLSLESDATVADVVAKVRELRAAGDAASSQSTSTHAHDPAHYVAIAEFERALTELNALKADRARERAAHTVEEAIRAGKIVPAQREWAIAYCAADTRGFQAFAAKQPSILGENLGLSGEPPAGPARGQSQRGRARNLRAARPQAFGIRATQARPRGLPEPRTRRRRSAERSSPQHRPSKQLLILKKLLILKQVKRWRL